MNKRDTVKGVAAGALAVWASGIGVGKSAFAAETPDWRDELLDLQGHHGIYYDNTIANETKSIYIEKDRKTKKVIVTRVEFEYVMSDSKASPGEIYWEGKEILKTETEFDTLKEAYLYAKQLKEKYYG